MRGIAACCRGRPNDTAGRSHRRSPLNRFLGRRSIVWMLADFTDRLLGNEWGAPAYRKLLLATALNALSPAYGSGLWRKF